MRDSAQRRVHEGRCEAGRASDHPNITHFTENDFALSFTKSNLACRSSYPAAIEVVFNPAAFSAAANRFALKSPRQTIPQTIPQM